jgi:hypothetical protein
MGARARILNFALLNGCDRRFFTPAGNSRLIDPLVLPDA